MTSDPCPTHQTQLQPAPDPQGEFTRAIIKEGRSGRFRKGKKRPVKEWIARLAIMLVSLAVAQVAVTLFLKAALGSDPYTVYAQGLSRVLGISVGMCHMSFSTLLLLSYFVFAREYILPGTVICTFGSGIFLDAVMRLFGNVIPPDASMPLRLATMLVGLAVSAIALAMLIRCDCGLGANDILPVILSDKLRVQYRWIKITVDIVFTSAGFLLGGIVGIGTLVSVLATGPVAQWFFTPLDRLIARILLAMGIQPTSRNWRQES